MLDAGVDLVVSNAYKYLYHWYLLYNYSAYTANLLWKHDFWIKIIVSDPAMVIMCKRGIPVSKSFLLQFYSYWIENQLNIDNFIFFFILPKGSLSFEFKGTYFKIWLINYHPLT